MQIPSTLALAATATCFVLTAAAPAPAPCTPPAAAFSTAQIARGASAYAESCAQCHGEKLEGTFAPPLNDAAFKAKWSELPVGDLTKFISDLMPPGKPGTLSKQQYHDITALMLSANGGFAGDRELDDTSPALAQCAVKE